MHRKFIRIPSAGPANEFAEVHRIFLSSCQLYYHEEKIPFNLIERLRACVRRLLDSTSETLFHTESIHDHVYFFIQTALVCCGLLSDIGYRKKTLFFTSAKKIESSSSFYSICDMDIVVSLQSGFKAIAGSSTSFCSGLAQSCDYHTGQRRTCRCRTRKPQPCRSPAKGHVRLLARANCHSVAMSKCRAGYKCPTKFTEYDCTTLSIIKSNF